jgi:hypothetical protein
MIVTPPVIVGYGLLLLVYFLCISWAVEGMTYGRAGTIALDLFTGTAPVEYQSDLESHAWLWGLGWFVRVLSWVFIPTVIGIFVGQFAGRLEAEARVARFTASAQEVGKEHGIDPKEMQDVIQKSLERAERSRGGRSAQ